MVDLSDTFMAPYASLLLAQMGADVVKVELPAGDITRQIGDFTGRAAGPIFLNTNRGKQSVVLDVRASEDYERFVELIRGCDVFLHNRRPSAAARLRIDYATLRAVNPALLHCSAVGFGSAGPYADRAAYDDVIQAACGMAAVQTGSGEPAYVRTPVADKVTGLLVFGAISAALYERGQSGQGQALEVPMFETMISFLALEQQFGFVFDPPLGTTGYSRTDSPYRRPYRTADGLIGVVVYTDAQWRSFFELVGRDDLATDARFATMGGRTEHVDELYRFLEDELRARSTAQWLEALADRGIPASRVNTIAEVFSDEHVVATGLFVTDIHPEAGRLRTARVPVTFSRTQPDPVRPAPTLGEHDRLVRAGASTPQRGAHLAGEGLDAVEQRGEVFPSRDEHDLAHPGIP
ncbi:CoA transferase [Jatrophihabitans cynanchi]|uniref:CoA transferase n=1 Tax=Jatrophihabitans cynanchi TaxID=2944128 RepID=A0ABY7K0X5_9ACTN|nr:CoA transferase [Jatrophihabitans sp. SB3-54]